MVDAKYSFGSFVLDPRTGILTRDGEPLSIGQRGVALLTALIEARGEAVSKDTLFERGWPGLTVEEANLSVQIAALRKVLGRTENGAEWIATVPRFGYRFLRTLARGDDYLSEPKRPVIAVLPFRDPSGAGDSAYFAEGVVEGIVAALSRFRGLSVTPSLTSAAALARNSSPGDIAATLGVRYLLQGSVLRSGERVRVSAHLLDAPAASQLWAERFEGVVADLFDLEDRVTEAIVGLVEPAISRAEIERARRKRPESLDAYDLYLRALPLFRTIEPTARAEAIRLLEQCVRLDPDFAAGLAQAAWAYERQDTFGTGMSDTERRRSLELAERAAELGHDDPQVVAISALILIIIGGQRERGLAMLAEARLANPNNPTVLSLFAFCNVLVGDLELGRQTFLKAYEISPAALVNYEILLGISCSHIFSKEFEAGVEWALRSIAANGEWLASWYTLAAAYGHLGQVEKAKRAVERVLALAPYLRMSHFERLDRRPNHERYRVLADGLRRAGLPD